MPRILVHGSSKHRVPQHRVPLHRVPRRRRLLALATAAAAAVLTAGGAQAAAAAPAPAACSGTVRIDSLAFNPAEIPAGQSSTATLAAGNCTGASQTVGETWAASWVSATSTGIPAGCPVIDPLPRTVTFAPYAHVSTSTGYLVFPGCTADGLRLTVTLSQSGTVIGRAQATLRIDRPAAAG